MIEVVYGEPSDEEMAAMIGALQQCHLEPFDSLTLARDEQSRRSGAWALAARFPDLDIEELRARVL